MKFIIKYKDSLSTIDLFLKKKLICGNVSENVSLFTILLSSDLVLTSILFVTIDIPNKGFNISDQILN